MSKLKQISAAILVYLLVIPAIATAELISNVVIKANKDETSKVAGPSTKNCVGTLPCELVEDDKKS